VTSTHERIHGVVFDFDGVVLESADIKTRAFATLFAGYPEHVDEIVRLHVENAGISRYTKFEQIHRDILRIPFGEADSTRLGDEFARLVVDEVSRCEFVKGADELLERLASDYRLFVASGTPEHEMREIVRLRDLDHLFAGVYGSPASKAEILSAIAASEGVSPGRLLFVGDSRTDYDGALTAGVPFVGRERPGDPKVFPGTNPVATVFDLKELDDRWEAIERAVLTWRR